MSAHRYTLQQFGLEPAESHESPTMPVAHRFSFGYFELGSDDALLVEFRRSEIPYWAIHLTNCWLEALSFDDDRARINNQTVERDPDGFVRILIADGVSGGRNSVDALGHREGTIVFRWSRTAEPVPELETRIVKRPEFFPG